MGRFAGLVIVMLLIFSGCSGGQVKVPAFRDFGRQNNTADEAFKDNLQSGLRTGAVGLGDSVSRIKGAYGEPDEMFVSADSLRMVYRRKAKPSIVLWFDGKGALASWSD